MFNASYASRRFVLRFSRLQRTSVWLFPSKVHHEDRELGFFRPLRSNQDLSNFDLIFEILPPIPDVRVEAFLVDVAVKLVYPDVASVDHGRASREFGAFSFLPTAPALLSSS